MGEEAPTEAPAGSGPQLVDAGEPPDRARLRWDPASGGGIASLAEVLQPDFSKLRAFDCPYVDRNQAASNKKTAPLEPRKIVARRDLIQRLEKMQANLSFCREDVEAALRQKKTMPNGTSTMSRCKRGRQE